MKSAVAALALALVLTAACSDDGPPAPSGPDAGQLTGQSFSVTFGPLEVPAGTEDTRCVEVRLGNVDAHWVGRLHTKLSGVSHHLIVYRSRNTEEITEPFPCTPFLDTLKDTTTPLMVSQIPEETLELPYGVAFSIEPDQMVRLEMHYVNATEEPLTVQAEATFDVMPDEIFQYEADFLFIGNPDIDLPPGPGTLGPTWFELPWELQDINVFAMTGHTHRFGTNVYVEHLEHADAPAMPVYDFTNWDWEEPEVAKFAPELAMPQGAGFRFTCEWNNTTGQRVGFGESANDEMCFFWSYYYPSQGHKVCAHTDQYGNGLDLCCPGHQLCGLLDDYLNEEL